MPRKNISSKASVDSVRDVRMECEVSVCGKTRDSRMERLSVLSMGS